MNLVKIFSGSSPTSRLGYGTTSLMAVDGGRERLHLLECAFDSGIRHFDTAPYYGYGEAERVLGEFLFEKRDQVTVTTKFGIQPPSLARNRFVNQMARKILRLAPSLRARLCLLRRRSPRPYIVQDAHRRASPRGALHGTWSRRSHAAPIMGLWG